jgi:hypothetical protein
VGLGVDSAHRADAIRHVELRKHEKAGALADTLMSCRFAGSSGG